MSDIKFATLNLKGMPKLLRAMNGVEIVALALVFISWENLLIAQENLVQLFRYNKWKNRWLSGGVKSFSDVAFVTERGAFLAQSLLK